MIPFIKQRNTHSNAFFDLIYTEWRQHLETLNRSNKTISIFNFFTEYTFKVVDITIPNCVFYKDLVVAEYERRKRQKEQAAAVGSDEGIPQTVQEHQPVQHQTTRPSVIHGPRKRPLTMQEVSDLDRPSTSGQRQPDGEPPAKRTAVAVISNDSEEIDAAKASSSSSSINVED